MPAQESKESTVTVLGIDPGTNVLGYGVLRLTGRQAEMVAMGVIDMRKCRDVYTKLGRIYERVAGLIAAFGAQELAIESPFFGKNVQSMLKLGRAQGVAIAAAISRGLPIHEYAPMKIKQCITGNGSATKEQVAWALKRMLSIQESDTVPFLDATDALGAAYCHFIEAHAPGLNLQRGACSGSRRHTMSWRDFAQRQGALTGNDKVAAPQAKLLKLLR